MTLDELLMEMYLIERLSVALDKILNDDLNVEPKNYEWFSIATSLSEVLKRTIKNIVLEVEKKV